MKRTAMIYLSDVFALLLVMLTFSTGGLLRYVLPPGSGRIVGDGTGWQAAKRPIALVWGLTRHDWGAIHFGIATLLLLFVLIHLMLHMRWIVWSFRKSRQARVIGALFLVAFLACLALAFAPFVSEINTVPRSEVQVSRGPFPVDAPR